MDAAGVPRQPAASLKPVTPKDAVRECGLGGGRDERVHRAANVCCSRDQPGSCPHPYQNLHTCIPTHMHAPHSCMHCTVHAPHSSDMRAHVTSTTHMHAPPTPVHVLHTCDLYHTHACTTLMSAPRSCMQSTAEQRAMTMNILEATLLHPTYMIHSNSWTRKIKICKTSYLNRPRFLTGHI